MLKFVSALTQKKIGHESHYADSQTVPRIKSSCTATLLEPSNINCDIELRQGPGDQAWHGRQGARGPGN